MDRPSSTRRMSLRRRDWVWIWIRRAALSSPARRGLRFSRHRRERFNRDRKHGGMIVAKFTSNGQFAGATYAYVAPTAGGGATDRGGSQRRDHAGGRGPRYDGHQHLPVADGAERGERCSEHRRAGRDRHPSWLWAWSRDGRVAPSQAPVDQLGGTQVTFGGIAAPLFSAQSQQVTVQVPWEIAGQTSTEIVVTYNGGPPAGTSSSVAGGCRGGRAGDLRRREFRRDAEFFHESGKGGRFHHDLRNRRRCDESSWNNGGIVADHSPLSTLTLPVSVTIGATNAKTLYAGSAPTLESGYFQINVALPSGLQASSALNLIVTVGGSSSAAVPISIQ